MAQSLLQRAKSGLFYANAARRALMYGEVQSFEPSEVSFVKGTRYEIPPLLKTRVTRGSIIEDELQAADARNWRAHFSSKLSGKGLEIGPLHRPMLRHSGMEMDYIDRYTVEHLRAHYPELRDFPLVEPTVIGNAETMDVVGDGIYDFLISSHVIEHMRNPLRSLQEWCRVVKPGGLVYLIVPDKRATFDKQRIRTSLEHLILDYQNPSLERDFEHYLDYVIHVHNKKGEAAIKEAKLLVQNDYSIHFHTFIPKDMKRALEWFSANVRPLSIVEGPCMAPANDEFHFLLRVR